LIVGFSSFAQDQNQPEQKSNKNRREKLSPEKRNQSQLDKMTTELNLDAKQQEQIKPIIAEQNAKRAAMQAERMANRDKQKKMTSEDREAFMKNRKEEKEAMDNKLKTILSPEQFKKMKENEEANRAKMRESRESREPRDNGEPRDNNDMQ
ncbi:hypothetical protein, partial [Flavobacterium sp. UBA6046]